MSKSTAISVTTESSDHYLFLEPRELNRDTLIEVLKNELGDEFNWISDFTIESSGYDFPEKDESEAWDIVQEHFGEEC